MIEFSVPGPVVAKARPRVVTLKSKSGRAFSHSYTPKKTVDYENHIRNSFHMAKPPLWEPYTGPVAMNLHVYIAIPASFSKKKRQMALDGLIFPETKPDVDNYLKIFMDSLAGAAFWRDQQVVLAFVVKAYAAEPSALVTIHQVVPPPACDRS